MAEQARARVFAGDRLPTLVTDRLVLRWLEPRDLDDLLVIFSDPRVMRYWSRPPYQDREEVAGLLRDIHRLFREQILFQWGLALRDSDRVVGTCTLFNVDLRNRRAEVGYALARAHWGQGLVREAVRTVIDLAFGPLDLRRLEADIDPRNQASMNVVEALGFRREGLLRERWEVSGELADSFVYGLLRRELGQA